MRALYVKLSDVYASVSIDWRRTILPVLTVVSFATAFLRDILFAKQLGAGVLSDAIWLALIIPAIFEQVFGGPLRDALIARLSGYSEALKSHYKFILFPTLLVSLIVFLPLWLMQEPLTLTFTPGWSLEARVIGIHVIAIGLLLIPGHTVYYSQWAIAASVNRFAMAHSRSIWLNLAAIVACLAFPRDPLAIVWGMLVGVILHAIMMEVSMTSVKIGEKVHSKPRKTPVQTSGLLHLVTFSLSALAPQICVLLERSLASKIALGSITHLSIAYRLSTIIMSITVASFIVPIYTSLERLSGAGKEEFWTALSKHLKWVFLLILPTCAILIPLAGDFTRFLFLRGAFTEKDVIATAGALRSYTIGVPFFCLILIFTRSLLALRSATHVILSAGLMLCSYLFAVYTLGLNNSVEWLALSFSLAQIVYALALFGFLVHKLGARVVLKNLSFSSISLLLFGSVAIYYFLSYWPFRSYFGLGAAVGVVLLAFCAAMALHQKVKPRGPNKI